MSSNHNKRTAWFLLIAVFFLLIDRLLKMIAINNFNGQDLPLFGNILKFSLQKNYNIAFSLPFHGIFLNLIIGSIIILLIYTFLNFYKIKDSFNCGFLILLIIGASSNLYDRIKYDFVIDYFDLKYFTVFNVADIMIVTGIFLLIINSLNKEKIYARL